MTHSICSPSGLNGRSSLYAHCHTRFASLHDVLRGRPCRKGFAFWALILWESLEMIPESGWGVKSFLNIHPTTASLLYLKRIFCHLSHLCHKCWVDSSLTGTQERGWIMWWCPSWCGWTLEGLLFLAVQWNGSHRRSAWGFGDVLVYWSSGVQVPVVRKVCFHSWEGEWFSLEELNNLGRGNWKQCIIFLNFWPSERVLQLCKRFPFIVY